MTEIATTVRAGLMGPDHVVALNTAKTLVIGSTVQAYTLVLQNTTASFTAALETKLNGIASGAQVNQNAFTTVAVSGQSNVDADAASDTLTFAAGAGLAITTTAGTDTVTFTVAGCTAAEFISNNATTKPLIPNSAWSAATPNAVSVSGALAFDMSLYLNRVITATGNVTFSTPTNVKAGQSGVIEFVHSGGIRTITLSGGWTTDGAAGLALSTVSGARDVLSYYTLASGTILVSVVALGV